MKCLLLVDDERSFLLSLKDGLAASGRDYEVVLAGDGGEALEVLRSRRVDLLVTDLKLPVVDGFQLLAEVSRHYPHLAVIVMTAFGTPAIEERLAGMNALHYLEKPLDFDALAETIQAALDTGSRSYIRGITPATFLQLVRMEQKSCTLRIHAGERTGYLFLQRGELLDAQAAERRGKEAVLEILSWEGSEIEMDEVCRRSARVIDQPLEYLLMEACRIKDEGNRADEAEARQPSAAKRPTLADYLRRVRGIRAFALFDAAGQPRQQSEPLPALEGCDPLALLELGRELGTLLESGGQRYLQLATAQGERYLFLARRQGALVLSLDQGTRAEGVLAELARAGRPAAKEPGQNRPAESKSI